MDPDKVLELANKARAGLGLPPMTAEQYEAAKNADTVQGRRFRASQEAGRRRRVTEGLLEKYPKPDGLNANPLARCYAAFLREEKTPGDEEYNRNLLEKMNTPEGVSDIIEDTVRKISELPDSVYFPKDEAQMISNYEQYGRLMDVMFNMENIRSNMALNDMKFSPAVTNFMDTHKGLFNLCGMQASTVNLWSSPYYPATADPTLDNMTPLGKACGKDYADRGPEQKELEKFGANLQPTVMYDIGEQETMEGGRKLLESGQKLKFANEDIYDAAVKAQKAQAGDITLKTLDEKGRAALNRQLDSKFTTTPLQREELLNKNSPQTPDMVKNDIDDLSALSAGVEAAKKNVFLGSKAYDLVAKDLEILEKMNKEMLKGNPSELSAKDAKIMKQAYEKLEKDCNTYLKRKKDQGELNADPNSKTGKRIKMVQDALKFGKLAQYRYQARENQIQDKQFKAEEAGLKAQTEKMLYDSLTPQTAGELMKNLNKAAAGNTNKEMGQKIVGSMGVVAKYMKDNNLSPADCGMNAEDLKKSAEVLKSGGVEKKPDATEKKQTQVKTSGGRSAGK